MAKRATERRDASIVAPRPDVCPRSTGAGILGDRRPASGNVLTSAVLAAMKSTCWHAGPKVVYGEACRLGDARLADERIVFRQSERLSLEERELLLDRLQQIVPHGIDPDIEKAWIEEAERRWGAIERGEMKTVPWEEVRKDLGLA